MTKNDSIFWPRQVKIVDIFMISAGWLLAGVIGSVILLLVIFLFGWITKISGSMQVGLGGWNPLFPLLLSFITFIISLWVANLTYLFLHIIDSERYKKTLIHFSQISLFWVIAYLIVLPIYFTLGTGDILIYIFLFHVLFVSFWEVIIWELLNNYRYILLWVYASFVGLSLSLGISLWMFFMFTPGTARLLSLLLLLPLSNACILFFKSVFEFLYYKYFMITGKDQLGDIFDQIAQQDLEALNEASSESNIY